METKCYIIKVSASGVTCLGHINRELLAAHERIHQEPDGSNRYHVNLDLFEELYGEDIRKNSAYNSSVHYNTVVCIRKYIKKEKIDNYIKLI